MFSRGVSRQNLILEDPRFSITADSAHSAHSAIPVPDPTPPEVGSHPRCLALASLQDDGTSGNLTPSNYIILYYIILYYIIIWAAVGGWSGVKIFIYIGFSEGGRLRKGRNVNILTIIIIIIIIPSRRLTPGWRNVRKPNSLKSISISIFGRKKVPKWLPNGSQMAPKVTFN